MVVLDFETNTRAPMDVLEVAALKLIRKDNTYEVVDILGVLKIPCHFQ